MVKLLNLVLILLLIIHSTSCNNKPRKQSLLNYSATIEFVDTIHDFKSITETDSIQSHIFEFTNTGLDKAVILHVIPSCKCTSVENYSRKPILPGERGFVTVSFNGTNAEKGYFDKSVKVKINSYRAYTLRIKGYLH